MAPFIGEIEHGVRGGSTPQDLETMFQLLYLRFTQPRADPVVFTAMAAQARALLANQDASPDVVFDTLIDTTLSRNSPRRQSETAATVDQWNLDTALAFYKARFADTDRGLESVAFARGPLAGAVLRAIRPVPQLPRPVRRSVPAPFAWGTGGSPMWGRA